MKKLKVGTQIKTNEDAIELIKNLVKNANEFAPAFIKKLATNYMSGSPLRMHPQRIDQLVDEILYEAMISGELRCEYGLFYKSEKVNAL